MKTIPSYYQEVEEVFQYTLGMGKHVIGISCPMGKEGVSILAHSLAQRCVDGGLHTLLIDLTDIGSQQMITHEQWTFTDISCQLMAKPLPLSKVEYLPGEAILKSDMNARDIQVLQEAVCRLRQEYDVIIFEMPPVLRVNKYNAVGLLCCHVVDACVLGLMWGISNEAQLIKAKDKLQKLGAREICLVGSQFSLPPLGGRILARLKRKPMGLFKRMLANWIQSQDWLMQGM